MSDYKILEIEKSFGIYEGRNLRKLKKQDLKKLNPFGRKMIKNKKSNLGSFKWKDKETGYTIQIVVESIEFDWDFRFHDEIDIKMSTSCLIELLNQGDQSKEGWFSRSSLEQFDKDLNKFLLNILVRKFDCRLQGDVFFMDLDYEDEDRNNKIFAVEIYQTSYFEGFGDIHGASFFDLNNIADEFTLKTIKAFRAHGDSELNIKNLYLGDD